MLNKMLEKILELTDDGSAHRTSQELKLCLHFDLRSRKQRLSASTTELLPTGKMVLKRNRRRKPNIVFLLLYHKEKVEDQKKIQLVLF